MSHFVITHWMENQKVQKKYEALEFVTEDDLHWVFLARQVFEKVGSGSKAKINSVDGLEEFWCFPKKRIVSEQGGRIEYDCNSPPPFYQDLKNREIFNQEGD